MTELQWPAYVAAFAGSLTVAWVLTPLLLKLALAKQVLDVPDHRKAQTSPVPYLGGVAIVAGFSAMCLAAAALDRAASVVIELAILLGVGLVLALRPHGGGPVAPGGEPSAASTAAVVAPPASASNAPTTPVAETAAVPPSATPPATNTGAPPPVHTATGAHAHGDPPAKTGAGARPADPPPAVTPPATTKPKPGGRVVRETL